MTKRQRQDAHQQEVVRAYYQTGDEAALGPLLGDLREQGLAYLRGRLRVFDTERAEDIAQDALARFLRLIRARRYEPVGRPAGVLFCVICKGLYLDSLRAKPSEPGRHDDPFHTVGTQMNSELVAYGEQTEQEAQAARTIAAATQAVLGLDSNARAAVVLHFYQGLPDAQAAQQLGISERSYHARLQRGLAALRGWGEQQARPDAEVYAALPRVDTGDLFCEPLRLAG